MRRFSKAVTTDASGNADELITVTAGKINAIYYVKHGSTPYDNGVDFTLTLNALGETVWAESNVNASTIRRPRVVTHKTDGVAILDGSGNENREPIAIASDKVRVVIANGGNAKVGTFYVFIE